MSAQNTKTRRQPLDIAFIGGGVNSAVGYAHFCACRLDNRWQLVAGAFSREKFTNKQSADLYNIASDRAYDSWQELLASEQEVDAIVVLTPTPSHTDIVCSALRRGYTVICEKALAENTSSARKIEAVLKSSKGRLLVTYNYSAYPMIREIARRVLEGQLGRLTRIQIEMPQEGFVRLLDSGEKPAPQQWRLLDGEIPTIHLDLTTHLHHLVYYITRLNPESLTANHHSYGWFPNVIDDAVATVIYQKGLTVNYWVSKSALGYKNGLNIRLMGTQASIHWQQTNPEQLLLNCVDGRREIIERGSPCEVGNLSRYSRFKPGHPAGFIESFSNLYTDFADAFISEKSGEENTIWQDYGIAPALEGLQLMSAMTESNTTKQWVKVNAMPTKKSINEVA